jgi:hypothetical protein
MDVSLSEVTKKKISIHALKYAEYPVGGILWGKSDGKSVVIDDVLPLLHSSLVGPIFDLGMESIESLFGTSGKALGWYFSNSSIDSRLDPFYLKSISNYFVKNSAVIIRINQNLEKQVFDFEVNNILQ